VSLPLLATCRTSSIFPRTLLHADGKPQGLPPMRGGTEFLALRTDAINSAARLETANKKPDARTCVAATVVSLHPDLMGRPVGNLVLRSRAEPFRSYEPWSSEVYADSTTAAYLDAFRKLEAGDRSAMPAFAALVGLHT